MCPNNAEEFAALEAVFNGNRPDTAGLLPLLDIVTALCLLTSDDAQSLNDAMSKHFRTGNVKKIFAELDADQSGFIDMDEAKQAVEILAAQTGLTMDEEEIEDELDIMDEDGNGDVNLKEFTAWWKSVSMSKKQKKLKKQQVPTVLVIFAQVHFVGRSDDLPFPMTLPWLRYLLGCSRSQRTYPSIATVDFLSGFCTFTFVSLVLPHIRTWRPLGSWRKCQSHRCSR